MYDFIILHVPNKNMVKWSVEVMRDNPTAPWGVIGDVISVDEAVLRYKESTRFKGWGQEMDVEDFDSWIPRKTLLITSDLNTSVVNHIKSRAAHIVAVELVTVIPNITCFTNKNYQYSETIIVDSELSNIPGFMRNKLTLEYKYQGYVTTTSSEFLLTTKTHALEVLDNNEAVVCRKNKMSGDCDYFISNYVCKEDPIPSCFRNLDENMLYEEISGQHYEWYVLSIRELIKRKGFRYDKWKHDVVLKYLTESKDNTIEGFMATLVHATKDKRDDLPLEYFVKLFSNSTTVWNKLRILE